MTRNNDEEKLVSLLFKTDAVKVCKEKEPFWYTSGTIGPYYINTHFLYGSEDKANELLRFIDEAKKDIFKCTGELLEKTAENYRTESVYKELIDVMADYVKGNIDLTHIDYISGGERRDWFFSILLASMLGKPHITIFKDMNAVVFDKGKTQEAAGMEGKRILHVADLITEASSYERCWIPAVKKLGGVMECSLAVVDRKQGGGEFLKSQGVTSYSMVNVEKNLFEKALALGYINQHQLEMVKAYIDDPRKSMRDFLLDNPDFIEASKKAGDRTRQRVELCLEKDIYNLNQ